MLWVALPLAMVSLLLNSAGNHPALVGLSALFAFALLMLAINSRFGDTYGLESQIAKRLIRGAARPFLVALPLGVLAETQAKLITCLHQHLELPPAIPGLIDINLSQRILPRPIPIRGAG